MSETTFINVKSSESEYSLKYLLKEACSDQVTFFQTRMGQYFPEWRNAQRERQLVYSIDTVPICRGEILYIKKKIFRVLWLPDHEDYKKFVDFAQAMCCHKYDNDWKERRINEHIDAIDKKRWFFIVFAILSPDSVYITNKEILEDKIRQMETFEKELEDMVSLAYKGVG